MTKNKFGKILVCCAVLGAAIAFGILYFTKYRDFEKSLEDDSDNFEDELEDTKDTDLNHKDNSQTLKDKAFYSQKREYVSIPYEPQEYTSAQ